MAPHKKVILQSSKNSEKASSGKRGKRRKEISKYSVLLSLPFKKRKHFCPNSNAKPVIRQPVVLLRNIFEDIYLCEKYNLYDQYIRLVCSPDYTGQINVPVNGNVSQYRMPLTDSVTNYEIGSSASNTSNVSNLNFSVSDLETTCSSTMNEDNITDCRQVTVEDLMIKVTKTVTNEPAMSFRRNCSNTLICDKEKENKNMQCILTLPNVGKSNWKLQNAYTWEDKLNITSCDVFFSSAIISNNDPLTSETSIDDLEEEDKTIERCLNNRKKNSSAGSENMFVSDLREKIKNEFKIPLPPAKRPPSRVKASNCSSSSASTLSSSSSLIIPKRTNVCKEVDTCFKDDDTISLYAHSIFGNDSVCEATPSDRGCLIETNSVNGSANLDFSIASSVEIANRNRDIQNWLNTVPHTTDSSIQTDVDSVSSTTQIVIPSDNSEVDSLRDVDCARLPNVSPKTNTGLQDLEQKNKPEASLTLNNKLITSKLTSVSPELKQNNCVRLINNDSNQASFQSGSTTPELEIPLTSNGLLSTASSTSQESERHIFKTAQKTVNTNQVTARSDTTPQKFQLRNTWAIPPALKGICKNFFVSGCKYNPCHFAHGITQQIKSQIFALDVENLMLTYRWTLQYSMKLFTETFNSIVRRLARLDQTATLLGLVDDILQQDLFDRTPFIRQIVQALQNMGFSFSQAIDELITAHGYQNLCFADILLNLIVDMQAQLESNWTLIRRIIQYRTKEIDYGVISDIMKHSLQLNSLNLCKNICTDILDKHSVKFECIDEKIITDFMTQLYSFKLFDSYYILRQKSGIHPGANAVPYSPTGPLDVVSNGSASPAISSRLFTVLPKEQLDAVDAEMTQEELSQLSCSLRPDNIHQFINLLQNYKCSCKVDSFAVNTVVCLTKMDHLDKSYWHMLKYVELAVPNFMEDLDLKKIIEQISYNVLDILTRNDKWEAAGLIVNKFSTDLDDFVKAREFKKECTKTLAARYLYFCKIFTKNDNFTLALAVLFRNDLKLLDPQENWTVESVKDDEMYRNKIVKELILTTLQATDIEHAHRLICYLIDNEIDIKCNVREFCSTLLIKMLDNYTQFKSVLIDMFKNKIYNNWYTFLKHEVLRGLCILLLPDIRNNEAVEFYNRCAYIKVYNRYKGNESEIHIATNALQEEIYLAFALFFYKMIRYKFQPVDLKVIMTAPKTTYKVPRVLHNQDLSFTELKTKIAIVLHQSFQVVVDPYYVTNADPFIIIGASVIQRTLNNMRNL